MIHQARNGIFAGGNWIIDIIKIIDAYPPQEALANILSESFSNGGSPYNLLIDLAKLKVNFPLEAFGLVGEDEKGQFIIDDCKRYKIDTNQLNKTNLAPTSYTDVMTSKIDGKRTFFHQRGANAYLDATHISLEKSQAKIFHLAYLLLLDKLDELDADGRTGASYIFEKAQQLGFKTSTDVVSENSQRFEKVVTSTLPFINYLFVNEFEAERITGIKTSEIGNILVENCVAAASALIGMGVKDYVILHFPMGCITVDAQRKIVKQGSVKYPKEKIAGAVGAGDAFCAGVLAGLHDNLPISECLVQGVSVAAACLSAASCSGGIMHLYDCLRAGKWYGFYEM